MTEEQQEEQVQEVKDERGKALGITGIVLGVFMPLVGLILGIIGAAKKDSHTGLGVAAIIVSVGVWILYMILAFSSM